MERDDMEGVLYGTAGTAAVAGAFLIKGSKRAEGGRSGFGCATGGFLLGAGSIVLALLELSRRQARVDLSLDGEEPSLASRILSRIPLRVKVATVAGAVKGGGGAAIRHARRKLSSRGGRPSYKSVK